MANSCCAAMPRQAVPTFGRDFCSGFAPNKPSVRCRAATGIRYKSVLNVACATVVTTTARSSLSNSESLPPQLSLGKDAGCCRGLLVIDIVTRPLQYVEIVQFLLQLSSETDIR